jgi:hypothetical protein
MLRYPTHEPAPCISQSIIATSVRTNCKLRAREWSHQLGDSRLSLALSNGYVEFAHLARGTWTDLQSATPLFIRILPNKEKILLAENIGGLRQVVGVETRRLLPLPLNGIVCERFENLQMS